jgi:protein-disulfide isomerase
MKKYIFGHFLCLCTVTLLFCLGCAAQSSSNPDLDRRIERQIRAKYELPPNVNLAMGPRRPSTDFPNFDQMTVTISLGSQQTNYEFLISKDAKTMYRLTKMDLSKDPYAEAASKISISGRPIRGNKDAKVTIVNFDDFQCPYCAMMHKTITQDIMSTYGDKVRLIYKDFPLVEIHPWAKHAAINANCLAKQNQSAYWNFADAVHANSRMITQGNSEQQVQKLNDLTMAEGQKANVNMADLQTCVKEQKDDAVKASMDEASLLGVEATPTLFINGEKIGGAIPASDLKTIINKALADQGEKPPAAVAQPAQAEPATSQKPTGGGL